jgi:Ca2+-binding EF-hand superfamily protein
LDNNQSGHLRKEDFTNIMFEVTKSILTPSQIMNVVSAYATPNESNVNYEEFMKIVNRAGSMMGENQDEAGPHLINALRD